MTQPITKAQLARLAGIHASSATRLASTALAAAWDGNNFDLDHPDVQEYLNPSDVTPPATGIDPLYEQAVQAVQAAGKVSVRVLAAALSIGKARAAPLAKMLKAANVVEAPNKEIKKPPPPKAPPPPPKEYERGTSALNTKKRAASIEKLEEEGEQEYPELGKFVDMTLRRILARYGSEPAFTNWLKALKLLEDIQATQIKNAEAKGKLVNRGAVEDIIQTWDGGHTRMLTDGVKTMAVNVRNVVETGGSDTELEDALGATMTTFFKPMKAKAARILRNA